MDCKSFQHETPFMHDQWSGALSPQSGSL